MVVGKNTRVAFLDQARAGLDDDKSIFDDVRGEGGGTVISLGPGGRETMELRAYLELFLFDGSKQRQKVGSLSGGERARVALAKVLREGANLLSSTSRPTTSICRRSRRSRRCSSTSTARCWSSPTTARFSTGWRPPSWPSSPTRPAARRASRATPAATRTTSRSAPSARRPPRRCQSGRPRSLLRCRPRRRGAKVRGGLTYAERLELEGIVERIDAAEARVAALEGKLAAPDLYAKRGGEVAGLQGELASARKEAASLVARWEELEARKEG